MSAVPDFPNQADVYGQRVGLFVAQGGGTARLSDEGSLT